MIKLFSKYKDTTKNTKINMTKQKKGIAFEYVKIGLPGHTPFWVQVIEHPGLKYGKGLVIDPRSKLKGQIVKFSIISVHKYIKVDAAQLNGLGGLDSPYIPAAESCTILDTIVPDSMDYESHISARLIRAQVGGSFTEFVKKKLQYTNEQLCQSLAAEQIDAVAMAIYNIERGQGMIIGDQTGIGKGRIAAAMIRYGYYAGLQPIFLSEKPNLFSDLYRDLADIGSDDLIPFIVNGKESKTDVKDVNGNVIYQALPTTEQNKIFSDKKVPKNFNYVMATYSQFNQPEKKSVKPDFLQAIAENNIIIMDEAHNASGSSNTGEFLQDVIKRCKGVTFLSATFAKRPDNMPIYALRTAMSDANMTSEELVESITKGGVALQEVLSSQLVAEGQMIRRERSFDGVEVNYIILTDREQEHKAISDNITDIIRDIIEFQEKSIKPDIDRLDLIASAEGKIIKERGGTSKAGVDNAPYFSKVFQIINQMLFSIKADAVADRAIERLKEGKKPVIAFANTMGSYLESMETDDGRQVINGDVINADFKSVLVKGLNGVMRYTVKDHAGNPEYKTYSVSDLSQQAKDEYYKILGKIESISTGITISPIDKIIQKIEGAGFSVAEVTGRKMEVQFENGTDSMMGVILARKKINVNDAFRQFNNNQVDALMINQSGSTGASAHAIKTDKVQVSDVKQRVMIILQAELNINTEVQKRGRINRTGQIYKPIYDYLISAIPAEKRLMMMLQKKLKSLDANTTSNQKNSEQVLTVDDFLNKYGDKLVAEYLKEYPELNEKLGDPMGTEDENKESEKIPENLAHKVSGRVAVLSTQEQDDFYKEIIGRYNDYVEYLKQIAEYDLEIEIMNLEAETLSAKTIKEGIGGKSSFGTDSIMEECRVNILKKPFSKTELDNLLRESLKGQDPKELQSKLRAEHKEYSMNRANRDIAENETKWDNVTTNIPNEQGYKRLPTQEEKDSYYKTRISEIGQARVDSIADIKQKSNNRYAYMDEIFQSYTPGQPVNYPVAMMDQGHRKVPSVFIGYQIDAKRANPYAPSAVKLRFALSDSNKYIALPCSGDQGNKILAIKGMSDFRWSGPPDYIENWEKYIKESSVNKGIRYIITGNLLQAFSNHPGKLISFTTSDGSVRKGILMPDKYRAKEVQGSGVVTIPIARGLKYIQGMRPGAEINCNNGIKIVRSRWGMDMFMIMVPKAKAYKDIYTDAAILKLIENTRDGFEQVSQVMRASVDTEKLPKVIQIFQDKYRLSIEVSGDIHSTLIDLKEEKVGSRKDAKILQAEREFSDEKEAFEHRTDVKLKPISLTDIEKSKARLRLLKLKLKLSQLNGVQSFEDYY